MDAHIREWLYSEQGILFFNRWTYTVQRVLALEMKENQVPTVTFVTENPGYLREEKTKSNTKKPKWNVLMFVTYHW